MADFTKKQLARSINAVGEARSADSHQAAGKRLPCHVVAVTSPWIVTIAFDVDMSPFTPPKITVPVAASPYIALPIQVGDRGYCQTSDVRLGGSSGLGSGMPGLDQPGNLAALVFHWLGNTAFTSEDPQAVVIAGPNGVVVKTADGSVKIVISAAGVFITGPLTINGQVYLDHEHSGVQTGGGNTGGVVP